MPEKQTVHRNISLYHDLFDHVKKVADRDHRGNFSRAIQCMIEADMAKNEMEEADNLYQEAVDLVTGGESPDIPSAMEALKHPSPQNLKVAKPPQTYPNPIKKTKKDSA